MKIVENRYRGTKEYNLVHAELISAAKYRGTITHPEIAKLIRLPLQGNYMGQGIDHLLAEIANEIINPDAGIHHKHR